MMGILKAAAVIFGLAFIGICFFAGVVGIHANDCLFGYEQRSELRWLWSCPND